MSNKVSRYKVIYQLPYNLYVKDSPVFIEKGGVFFDTYESSYLAVLKIVNLSHKKIRSARILVTTKTMGGELDSIYEYTYEDLNVGIGENFGEDESIGFNKVIPKKIDVCVYQVEFEDGKIWSSKNRNWRPISSPLPIKEYFNDSFLEGEFLKTHGQDARYVPVEGGGIFKCTCGTVNPAGHACSNCGRIYADLKNDLSPGHIEKIKMDKIRLESEIGVATEEYEKKKTNRGLNNTRFDFQERIIVSFAFCAVVLCAIVILSTLVVIPGREKKEAYEIARNKLEAGLYEEARTDFMNLNGFEDSENLSKEAIYRSADSLENRGELEAAIESWQSISEYSDSQSRITRANERLSYLQEVDYLNARVALTDGNFENAIALFENLGTYRDSADYENNSRYQYGMQLLNNKQYFEAISQFESIIDYGDSRQKIAEAKNNYILDQENGSYTYGTYTTLTDSASIVNFNQNAGVSAVVTPWKASISATDSLGNPIEPDGVVSVYDSWYITFKVFGGNPGKTTEVYYKSYFPGGKILTGVYKNPLASGQTGSFTCAFSRPETVGTGRFLIQLFDDSENLMGTYYVNLTGK